MNDTPNGKRRLSSLVAGALAAAGGALAWAAWLSWPTAGTDYHPAQVLACAGTCAAVAVGLALRSTHGALLTVPLGGTIGVAVPWAWRAATSDETGLWLVGLLFLVVGVGLGLALVVGITVGIADRRRGR